MDKKAPGYLPQSQVDALLDLYHEDVFSVLGPHKFSDQEYILRVYQPDAVSVHVIAGGITIAALEKVDSRGFFVGMIPVTAYEGYKLQACYESSEHIFHDPYRFPSLLSETDLYLFGEGTHERLYQWLGAHEHQYDGVNGTLFTLWAPNAKRVSVVGDFNFWDGRLHIMRKHLAAGIWEIFIPDIGDGALYKFEILSNDGLLLPHKSDPMAFSCECPPKTASRVVSQCHYQWHDEAWSKNLHEQGKTHQAVSIYEVHLGSWRRNPEDPHQYLSYKELSEQLVTYVKDLGFTHIQLMPVSEYPFDGSWGYQPVGLYAPTSRFGTPQDFKYFVDQCHQQGIGVLIDWVPGHFPEDGHGLSSFDGTALYEHSDSRQGFHPDWSTYIYNYGRCEVANYLSSNALYWFDEYHIDGLRVDAVASMLYLDYSREDGEWIPNKYGGRENLEAISLIKRINEKIYELYPHAMMVAEESTAWPGVSQPTYAGGLGFGYKWNMGWMNDSLRYMSNDPIHRSYHHNDMTFSLLYAFNENFILPLSHDEVVHGKGSLLDKMPGDGWQKFANLRAYYGFMWAHPGKKLLFMGGEFAQGKEWDHSTALDWHLLDIDYHKGVQRLIVDLNALYTKTPSLYFHDCEGDGFEWISADDSAASIFAFARKAEGISSPVVVISNMTPVLREGYRLGVPNAGFYAERINSDSHLYGGSDKGNAGGLQSEAIPAHGRAHSILLTLPPLATVIFEQA